MAGIRLGDIIDDHCTRCHRLTNHSVVAMIGEEVKKVRCRTCNHEHEYRHEKGGKKPKAKLSPYDEVLASITAGRPGEPPPTPPEAAKPVRKSARGLSRSRRAS